MSCGVGHRGGSDLILLWLWHKLAAVAPIRPLAWDPPYAAGTALKRPKKQNKTKQNMMDSRTLVFLLLFGFGLKSSLARVFQN